ncbi:MAG: pyridoxal phosphate-dependent aminotransferase [Patescibacteria group bacterium]
MYDNGDILKLTVAVDPNIVRADMPAVNRTSAELKNLGTIVQDALIEEGKELVQAGIGDANTEYTLRDLAEAINSAAHRDVLPISGLVTPDAPAFHLEYGDVRGIHALITVLKNFLGVLLGIEVRDYVTITHGGRSAVFMAVRSFTQFMVATLKSMGVEGPPMVAVPVETWGTYPNIVAQALGDGVFHPIPCRDGLLDAEALDEACTRNPRIRMLIFCNPVNPSGRTYGSDRMARIARIVAKHKLCVHADDMYAMFAWVHPHRSILRAAAALAHSGEKEVGEWVASHTTLLTGVMKAGGSGSRVNFMVIPNDNLRARFVANQGDLYGPPNMMGQLLQLAFIKHGGPERVWLEMKERRDALQAKLTEVAGRITGCPITLTWSAMEGGFYTAMHLNGIGGMKYTDRSGTSRVIMTGEDMARFLVQRAGIVATPDVAACVGDVTFARIAYGMMRPETVEVFGNQLADAVIGLCAENGHNPK